MLKFTLWGWNHHPIFLRRKWGTEALNNSFKIIYPIVYDSQKLEFDVSDSMFYVFYCEAQLLLYLVKTSPSSDGEESIDYHSLCLQLPHALPAPKVPIINFPKWKTSHIAVLLIIPSMAAHGPQDEKFTRHSWFLHCQLSSLREQQTGVCIYT